MRFDLFCALQAARLKRQLLTDQPRETPTLRAKAYQPVAPEVDRHGLVGYTDGCRCVECRVAWHQRQSKARIRERRWKGRRTARTLRAALDQRLLELRAQRPGVEA